MLELAYVREHLDRVEASLRARGYRMNLDEFRRLDQERNQASDAIGRAKKEGKDAAAAIAEMKKVGERIKGLDQQAAEFDRRMEDFLLTIPHIPHESVPGGGSPPRD